MNAPASETLTGLLARPQVAAAALICPEDDITLTLDQFAWERAAGRTRRSARPC